jgi:phosphate transport system protein
MSQENMSETSFRPTESRRGLVAQDKIWGEVLKLAAAAECILQQAVQALCEGRAEVVAEVKAQERNIDRWEVRIEKECLRILALYEPLASDLRRMVSVLKLTGELERVSDLATKIAKRTKRSYRDSSAPHIPAALESLARMALTAFTQVVAALANNDAIAARAVIAGEDEVNRQCRAVLRELKQSLRHEQMLVKPSLRLVNSARNLERIADHCVKIAEAIVYIKG